MLENNIIISTKVKEKNKRNVSDQIIQIAKENNGVVTTADITERGILRGNIKTLLNSGKLERTARGVYILPEIWEDEFVNLQARFRKGIFSNKTALFFIGFN